MNQSDQEFAEKYGVMIDTPAITDSHEKVFLIRHGFSEFNYKHLILKRDGGAGKED